MATERESGMLLLFDAEPSPDEMLDMVKTLKQEFKKLETRKRERVVENCELVETLQPKQRKRKKNSGLKRKHPEIACEVNHTQQAIMECDLQKVQHEPTAHYALPCIKVRRTTATTTQEAQTTAKNERRLDSRLSRLLKSKQKDTTSDVGSTSSNDSGIHLGSLLEEAEGNPVGAELVTVSASAGADGSPVSASAVGNQIEHNIWLPLEWNTVKPQVEPLHQKLSPTISSRVGVAAECGHTIPDVKLYVALDCEFVGVGPKGCRSALARCSVVDYQGKMLCDVYSCPEEPVTDYRTRWSGIRPRHMKNAIPLESARRMVKKILKNKIVIGHSVRNDFGVLGIEHPVDMVRDTVTYTPLHMMAASDKDNPPRSLKKLSSALLDQYSPVRVLEDRLAAASLMWPAKCECLTSYKYIMTHGRTIQNGPHSSLEDALATLDLFKLVRYEWEAALAGVSVHRQMGSAARSRRQRTVSETSLENAYLKDDYWPCDL